MRRAPLGWDWSSRDPSTLPSPPPAAILLRTPWSSATVVVSSFADFHSHWCIAFVPTSFS